MSEKQLREAWLEYQKTAHPDDKISYMDFRSEMGVEYNEYN
jgi:hypothetical protein